MTAENGHILQRIQAVQRDLAKVRFVKDKWVGKTVMKDGVKVPDRSDRNGYWVMSINEILRHVGPAQAEHGVSVFFEGPFYDQSGYEQRKEVEQKDRDGYTYTVIRANGHYRVTITGGDMTDSITRIIQCEAKDSSDKLNNKLLTNAMRSLYRSLYSIDADDGDDPEDFNTPIQVPAPAPKAAAPAQPTARGQDSSTIKAAMQAARGAPMTMTEMKAQVLKHFKQYPDHEVRAEFEQANGPMVSWQLGTFKHVYQALEERGEVGA